MTTPQPEKLRPSSPERYEEMSRHLLLQAEEELDKGDVLQASEKIWLAVAHALKAVAQYRGWNHRYHNHLRAAASCLSMEWGRPDWLAIFGTMDNMHTNAYEHQWFPSELRPFLEPARAYCQELSELRQVSPPQDILLTAEEQVTQSARLRTLTRPLSERAAFGPQLSSEEEAELPPIVPSQP